VLLTLAGLALLGGWPDAAVAHAGAEGGAGEVGGGLGQGKLRFQRGLLLAFQRDVIIALALAEAAAVLGFVLGFLAVRCATTLHGPPQPGGDGPRHHPRHLPLHESPLTHAPRAATGQFG
jgi:hypothetical protein